MIHILPHLEYSIDSAKSPEDINEILKSVTAPKKMVLSYLSYPDNIEFIGEVNPSGFKIVSKPKPHVKNSFIPVIVGTIRTGRGLTVIDIKMRLYLFVQIFLTIWFGGAGLGVLAGFLAVFTEGMNGMSMLFATVAFFAFGQVFARIGFYFPAKNASRRLEELLK